MNPLIYTLKPKKIPNKLEVDANFDEDYDNVLNAISFSWVGMPNYEFIFQLTFVGTSDGERYKERYKERVVAQCCNYLSELFDALQVSFDLGDTNQFVASVLEDIIKDTVWTEVEPGSWGWVKRQSRKETLRVQDESVLSEIKRAINETN